MTPTNWFNNLYIHGIRQWYFLIILWYCIYPYDSCPSGTFKSDFLSGGCAKCPKKAKYCENEEYEDSVRCFKACSKPRQIKPTTAPSTGATSAKTSPTNAIPTTDTIETKRIFERITGVINNTLLYQTEGHLPNKQSENNNWTEIAVGMFFSVVALIILVAGVAIYWKMRGNSGRNDDQRWNDDSRLNSDQRIDDTEGRLENFRMSQEHFEQLRQSQV